MKGSATLVRIISVEYDDVMEDIETAYQSGIYNSKLGSLEAWKHRSSPTSAERDPEEVFVKGGDDWNMVDIVVWSSTDVRVNLHLDHEAILLFVMSCLGHSRNSEYFSWISFASDRPSQRMGQGHRGEESCIICCKLGKRGTGDDGCWPCPVKRYCGLVCKID